MTGQQIIAILVMISVPFFLYLFVRYEFIPWWEEKRRSRRARQAERRQQALIGAISRVAGRGHALRLPGYEVCHGGQIEGLGTIISRYTVRYREGDGPPEGVDPRDWEMVVAFLGGQPLQADGTRVAVCSWTNTGYTQAWSLGYGGDPDWAIGV